MQVINDTLEYNYEILFLKYIFPDYNFVHESNNLYIKESFRKNYSVEVLKSFGFFRIYTFENKFVNLVSRKRERQNNIFSRNEWYSPSKIKLVTDEPFKLMINELCRSKVKYTEIDNLVMKKGNDYEAYILKELSDRLSKMNLKVLKLCEGFPNLNNYTLLRDSYMAICEGNPVIYQPLLIDVKTKMMGLPDFLIRCDIFNKLFPNDSCKLELNCFGKYNYIVLDVKLAGCKLLKDGYLNNEKSVRLNKLQVYIYQRLLENIEGVHKENINGYILGSKTIENNNIYHGIEKLGLIDVKKNDKFESDIINGINLIDEVRKVRNIKDLLRNREFKPKRCRSYYFPKSEDGYSEVKRELGYYNNVKFKFDKSNIDNVLKELKNYNLVYVDFETINLLLNLDCEDFQRRVNETNNEVCQIGVMYKNRLGSIHYKSFYANEYNPKVVKDNFKRFVNFVLKLKGLNDKELCMVTWGNLETSIYEGLKEKYSLPEIKIIDLHSIIKSNKVFNDIMSLSLKKLIPILNNNYPKSFPNKYRDLEIQSGSVAFNELFNYYKLSDKNDKLRVRNSIESYNRLDCLVMLQLVDWMKEMCMDK